MNLATIILEGYKKYSLKFKGYYYVDGDSLPEEAGIYCVYRADSNILKELLYIGQTDNIKERFSSHEHYDDWEKHLIGNERLVFSYASVLDEDERKRLEAALIFRIKPVCNEQDTKSFGYDTTEITITIDAGALSEKLVVHKNERSK